MKENRKDVSEFLCVACRTQARSLTAGRAIRCEHNGVRITIDANGKHTLTWDQGQGPKGFSGISDTQTGHA